MPDIHNFKDELLLYLNEEDKANPNKYIDITAFIKSYDLTNLHIMAPVINELFAPKDRSAALITSENDLGTNGFTQGYFNRHVVPPVKTRIVSAGKDYLNEKESKFVIGQSMGYQIPPEPYHKQIKAPIKHPNTKHSRKIKIILPMLGGLH